MSQEGGFTNYNYKAVEVIESVKVLKDVNSKKSTNLPERSNTPDTKYISLTKDNAIKQMREYDSNRKPKVDIDFDHSHNGVKPHIHTYKNGERNDGRALTKTEEKKYGKILKAAEDRK